MKSITSRAFKILGFIIRSTQDFNDVHCILYLFKSLVIPILSYCSTIWTPYSDCHNKTLESVQRKFFRYLAYKSGRPMAFDNHNYRYIAIRYSVPTIKSLHKLNDYKLIWMIRNKLVDCTQLKKIFSSRSLPTLRPTRQWLNPSLQKIVPTTPPSLV